METPVGSIPGSKRSVSQGEKLASDCLLWGTSTEGNKPPLSSEELHLCVIDTFEFSFFLVKLEIK
jgi:hypothetical protein